MRVRFLALILLPPIALLAQEPDIKFQHLTVEDGLTQDIVTAIAQDSFGFMWFGTEDGLNLYDGYSITQFRHSGHDSSSINGNSINALIADHSSRLWVGASRGADIVDIRTRKISHLRFSSDGRRVDASAFSEAADSSIWIAGGGGLLRYRNGRARPAILSGKPFIDEEWGVFAQADSVLWLIGPSGIRRFRSTGDTLSVFELPAAFQQLRGSAITTLLLDGQKTLWVCTGHNGIFRFDSTLAMVRHYVLRSEDPSALLDNRITAGIQDRAGTIWFGTSGNLEMYDPLVDGFRHIKEESAHSSGFLGSRVYSLFVDRTGILWIGTYRGGVNSFAAVRQMFRTYVPPAGSNVRDIYAIGKTADGKLLVGTNDGLFEPWSIRPATRWTPVEGTTGKAVFSLCKRRNGDMLFGTYASVEKVPRSHQPGMSVKLPIPAPLPLLFEDKEGHVWIGTDDKGIYLLDESRQTMKRWAPDGEAFEGGAWTMFQDRIGHLWIGTWATESFFEYDKVGGSIRRFGSDPRADVHVPFMAVRSFRQDSAGILWLATWGSGLFRLDTSTQALEQFTQSDGLASDFVKSMEIDRLGKLWIGTEHGLCCFDPASRHFTTYRRQDGLPSDFFFSGSSYRDPDGTLYFGAQGGFIVFDPDSIPQNRNIPAVAITSFKILDRPVPFPVTTTGEEQFTLRHDEDFFSFEFTSLDFTAPERNQYEYMLEGFDKGWVRAGTRRYASYTHLDPGAYTFRVRASNNDGIWNQTGASMTITIKPAYWMTWWFRGILLCMLVLAAFAFYRYRMRRIVEVELLRQRIARDLHDDIGTNLSTIVLASQASRHLTRSRAARTYLDDIRSVALFTQDQMRDIVWMLNPRNDPPDLFLARMKDEAAHLLQGVSYTFKTTPEGMPSHLDLGLKRSMFLVYKEALHNIARHAAATSVEITVGIEDAALVLTVRDNGRGFDPRTVARGNGLDNMQARARQAGALIEVRSVPGAGTAISFRGKTT